MNNLLKKVFCVAMLVFGISFLSNAQGFEPGQGFKQVDFGIGVSGWGIPIYAGADFAVNDNITIGPRVSYRRYNYGGLASSFHYTIFNISFRGDYHFASLIEDLPQELDLYGGLSLGYSVWGNDYKGPYADNLKDSRMFLAVQVGARWYFSENWAVNAEASGGSLSGLDIGLSYMF